MRKRFGALALLMVVAALGLVVVGCGDDDDDEGTTAATTTEQATTDETTTDTTTDDDDDADAEGTGDDDKGQQIFASNCATCHGEDGSGGAGGPPLRGSGVSFDRAVDQVTNGGGGMPPFGDVLSKQEIADVATYVADELADE